jgi:hypothetical protein
MIVITNLPINLPINLEYLYIYVDTVLLDIPHNLIRLRIKWQYKGQYKDSNANKDITGRLVAEGR